MRNRFSFLPPVFNYLGALCWIFGFVIAFPILAQIHFARRVGEEISLWTFVAPAVLSFVLGFVLKRDVAFPRLSTRQAMMLCALGWVVISALGAIPFSLGLKGVHYLDAFFESVSGFTTTGITMLTGLDVMPKSVLLWRSVIQWLGGLGILTFFLAIMATRGAADALYSAETHKIFSKRPAPGLFNTLRILWGIYLGYTVIAALLFYFEGMSRFDAVCHAMTALSTGGYSPHDASIDYYRLAGFQHYRAIEYTVTFMMFLGGVNFFIHYRVLTGGLRALWDNLEMRLWWGMLLGATACVMFSRFLANGFQGVESTFRYAVFQVVSLATTTGFGTKDIGTSYFAPLAKQVFMLLMVVGGCVGSTGGGVKVLRIGVLMKMVGRQLRHVMHGSHAVTPVMVDGEVLETEELRRVSALFFAWMALLAIGSGATALFAPDLDAFQAASGMFSALGNIGPCYISVDAMTQLHPVVKVTYIVGMLAGRLEILPILLLFRSRAWR